MTDQIKILGIDLASRHWRDNGSALLTFRPGAPARWEEVVAPAVNWPEGPLSAEILADAIHRFAIENGVHAISLDGPQGWREPNAPKRSGVGRWCEYQARAQGKTGEFDRTYPKTQLAWIRFCIDVFGRLMAHGQLVNDPKAIRLEPPARGEYWLLECFPTSTWRTAQLRPLPGKARTSEAQVYPFAETLWNRFELPGNPPNSLAHGGHDNLQAVVACLPGAGLLGGPCSSVPHGTAGYFASVPHKHWVEGLIWDAKPSERQLEIEIDMPQMLRGRVAAALEVGAENPLVVEERDDYGEELLDCGIQLFRHLCDRTNAGESIGVGYKQLVELVHKTTFTEVVGRGWSQTDVPHVLELSTQITAAAGGRTEITRGATTIQAGMDTFVWQVKPPHSRSATAFERTPYTQQEWTAMFPDGQRRLLAPHEWQCQRTREGT